MIQLWVPNEESEHEGETRVATTPEQVSRLAKLGVSVLVERGAGKRSSHGDAAYVQAGATVVDDAEEGWSSADIVAVVNPPSAENVKRMKPGAILLGLLAPTANLGAAATCAERGVTAMSFDSLPRISRAQSVDALTAMSTIAGYKAVLLGAAALPKMLPLLMTAAGTVTASKVFVIGAGVAGLQAIATAKRLGAVVSAFDVRPAVREQVESLGARFVEFKVAGKEGAGGYAVAQTESEQAEQRRQMAEVIAGSDIVITTALVPGKPAPKLIDAEAVRAMRPGSVIVDLAAEAGGNCALTRPGAVVSESGVTIIGTTNLPATVPIHASQLYARVVATLISWIVKEGRINLDFNDEVIAGMTIVHGGDVRSKAVNAMLAAQAAPAAS